MIKKILVPTDGSRYGAVGASYAISLAKQHDAMLHGLHVIDVKLLEGPFLRDISASLGTAPYVNYQNNMALILEERGKAALTAFSEACEEAGIPHETSQATGSVARCIVERSELADLLIMGRSGEHADWLDGLLGSTTEAVVRRAQSPVLVTGREAAKIEHFVVAYDNSPHSKKALQIGAAIGETWGVPFDVLWVGKKSDGDPFDEARSYLAAHAIEVEYVPETGDPSEVLVEYTRKQESDLLVMGAYGHTKVRELVVGSTTAFAINHSPCPILLTR